MRKIRTLFAKGPCSAKFPFLVTDYEQRFGGLARLISRDGLERLRRAHVCVIGVGGVGSWAVESLARSGIGELTLIDLDDVCITNINRQLPALDGTVGRPKIDILAEHVNAIYPGCKVHPEHTFFTKANANEILDRGFDFVIDAIDNAKLKSPLIAGCRDREIPVITVGGAGGLRNPCAVEVADLSKAYNDSLLAHLRKRLRQDHGFPRGEKKLGVPCVFSTERPVYAHPDGGVCQTKPGADGEYGLNCESGIGSASFTTGTFGFAAAGYVVDFLSNHSG